MSPVCTKAAASKAATPLQPPSHPPPPLLQPPSQPLGCDDKHYLSAAGRYEAAARAYAEHSAWAAYMENQERLAHAACAGLASRCCVLHPKHGTPGRYQHALHQNLEAIFLTTQLAVLSQAAQAHALYAAEAARLEGRSS